LTSVRLRFLRRDGETSDAMLDRIMAELNDKKLAPSYLADVLRRRLATPCDVLQFEFRPAPHEPRIIAMYDDLTDLSPVAGHA
jgi:hypothetical protein